MNITNQFPHCGDPNWVGPLSCRIQPSLLPNRIKELFDLVSQGFSKITDCQVFARRSCLCPPSPEIRIIDQPLLEIRWEDGADSLICKSNDKKEYVCTGTGTFSNYTVEMDKESCVERVILNEDAEAIAFCGPKGFILMNQLLNPSENTSSDELPSPTPDPDAVEFDFDHQKPWRRSNTSEADKVEVACDDLCQSYINDLFSSKRIPIPDQPQKPDPKPRRRERIRVKFEKRHIVRPKSSTPPPAPQPPPTYSSKPKDESKLEETSLPNLEVTAGLATVTALLAYIGRELCKDRTDGRQEPLHRNTPTRRVLAAKKL